MAPPPAEPPARPRPAPKPAADSSNRGWWPILLVLLLGVVGGLAYYFTQSSHPDEELTSASQPPAATAPATKPARVVKPPVKPARRPKAKRKTTRVVPKPAPVVADSEVVAEEEASPAEAVAAAPAAPAPTPRPLPAVPEAGDSEAMTRVRNAMASYYADLNTPPLHASQHFAPQVERLYIRQNLTPAAIDAELGRSFFPDNQQVQARIDPGTLHVSDPAADGSRTATFTEQMRLYRPSLQKYQRLRTQVRVRFNADYQIVYMRQEKLLSNAFEE